MTNPIIPVFDGHNDLPWESRDNRHYSVEGIDPVSYTHLTLPTT